MPIMKFFYLIIICAIFICGCAGKPSPPPLFKTWGRKNTSADEVKAALIECGLDNPYIGYNGNYSIRLGRVVTGDDVIKVRQCMKQKGFAPIYFR